jgi:hypothetical protein
MSTTLCKHIVDEKYQPMVCIEDTFLCGPCACDKVGELIHVSKWKSERIVAALDFYRCAHGMNHPGNICTHCFDGIRGWLSIVRAHARLSGDKQTSDLLYDVVKQMQMHVNGTRKSRQIAS